jgi:hypothetical protein
VLVAMRPCDGCTVVSSPPGQVKWPQACECLDLMSSGRQSDQIQISSDHSDLDLD